MGEQPRRPQAIPAQKCIFLVVVEDEKDWLLGVVGRGEAVKISAKAPSGLAEATVQPGSVMPGGFAELTVIPTTASVPSVLTVTIAAERRGLTESATVSVNVLQGEDGLGEPAVGMRERFVPWLVANHPELGITNETEWTGTIVNPNILVVMHYMFLSYEWEMYVTWHVTIPPYDWARIYLRHRFTETRPSYAFEISSVGEEPHPTEVPDWV